MSTLGSEAQTDSRMIVPRQKMIDVLIPDDLEFTDDNSYDKQCYAELLWMNAQLCAGLKSEDGKTMRQYFAEETKLEDWASFFREYDVFKAWHKKELNNTRIRNMRKVMSQIRMKDILS